MIKRLYDWFRWNQDAQFFVGSVIAFLGIAFVLLLMTACAALPTPEEIAPTPEQQEVCALVYEHVRWMMARAVDCKGWVRL